MLYVYLFILYVCITFMLYFTIPDVLNESGQKWDNFKHCLWWPISFLGLLLEGVVMIWRMIKFKFRKKD